jgi:hypothetical protein
MIIIVRCREVVSVIVLATAIVSRVVVKGIRGIIATRIEAVWCEGDNEGSVVILDAIQHLGLTSAGAHTPRLALYPQFLRVNHRRCT